MSETTSDRHMFWIKVKAEYPETATKAPTSLLPFPTPHLCEAGLSAVTAAKDMTEQTGHEQHISASLSPEIPDGDHRKRTSGSH